MIESFKAELEVVELLRTDPAKAQRQMTDFCAGLQEKAFEDAKALLNEVRWAMSDNSNTMKMGTMKAQLPESLTGANHVVCYAAPTLSWDVAEAMLPLGEKVDVLHSIEETVNVAVNHARSGDYILVMSNGGFGGIHGKLLDALKRRA